MRTLLGLTVVLALTTSAWSKPGEVPATSRSPAAVAAYHKAQTMFELSRRADGLAELRRAVKLDPGFALANAALAAALPGPEGDALMAKATAGKPKLPDGERLAIEGYAAQRSGNAKEAEAITDELADLFPGDAHAQIQAALAASLRRDGGQTIDRSKKALAADPKLATGYNLLAYAYAMQRKWDDAIATAKKQVELLPKEPNPVDTLAEIELWAGKHHEAEIDFQQALKIAPSFAAAWEGVALARYFRGDWKGGDEALAKGRQVAGLPEQRFQFDSDLAWVRLAQGKLADGLAVLTLAEKQPDVQELPIFAQAAVVRGFLDLVGESYAEALGEAATAIDRAEKGAYAPAAKIAVRRQALAIRALAEIKLGKLAEAEKTAAAVAAEAAKLGPNMEFQAMAAWVRGALAEAKGDKETESDAYAVCLSKDLLICLHERLAEVDKAGDKASADAIRKEVMAQYYRDPVELIVRARAGAH
jgi:tetratricopeptide (TPR) repeat protein